MSEGTYFFNHFTQNKAHKPKALKKKKTHKKRKKEKEKMKGKGKKKESNH